jgi:hypothetical protein
MEDETLFFMFENAHATTHRIVALQVAFERQTLKPAFSLDRLYVMGLKAIGYGIRVK